MKYKSLSPPLWYTDCLKVEGSAESNLEQDTGGRGVLPKDRVPAKGWDCHSAQISRSDQQDPLRLKLEIQRDLPDVSPLSLPQMAF